METLKNAVGSRSKHQQSRSLGHNAEPLSSSNDMSEPEDFSYLANSGMLDSQSSVDEATKGLGGLRIDGAGQDATRRGAPMPVDASHRSDQGESQEIYHDAPSSPTRVPPRKSSMPRKPLPNPKERRSRPITPSSPQSRDATAPTKALGHKPTKSLDLAPNDPSPLVPRRSPPPPSSSVETRTKPYSSGKYYSPQSNAEPGSSSQEYQESHPIIQRDPVSGSQQLAGGSSTSALDFAADGRPLSSRRLPENKVPVSKPEASTLPAQTSSRNVGIPEHVRLPEGWSLGNTERTIVDTQWAPSVTQETIVHQQKEIIYQPVEKHIHIDHYYHYEQPIKVLEVLPPKHFRLDPTSGQKFEIPAPEGFELPAGSQPQPLQTELLGKLEPTTRHYVVDEAHPRGQEEGPPLRHKQDMSSMNGAQ